MVVWRQPKATHHASLAALHAKGHTSVAASCISNENVSGALLGHQPANKLNEGLQLKIDQAVGFMTAGIGNIWHNKGAVGITLTYMKHTRLLFINAHFNAHDKNVAQRQADYLRIRASLFSNSKDSPGTIFAASEMLASCSESHCSSTCQAGSVDMLLHADKLMCLYQLPCRPALYVYAVKLKSQHWKLQQYGCWLIET